MLTKLGKDEMLFEGLLNLPNVVVWDLCFFVELDVVVHLNFAVGDEEGVFASAFFAGLFLDVVRGTVSLASLLLDSGLPAGSTASSLEGSSLIVLAALQLQFPIFYLEY